MAFLTGPGCSRSGIPQSPLTDSDPIDTRRLRPGTVRAGAVSDWRLTRPRTTSPGHLGDGLLTRAAGTNVGTTWVRVRYFMVRWE